MFSFCINLTEAPELPATTLADNCYDSMFYDCTSLTTAPELPAITLTYGCYWDMFSGCSTLNKITMLATDISAYYCLNNWVNGVASSGTFVKSADMTSLPTGANGIPTGWTVVDYSDDGNDTSKNLITFTIDGTEYQAEEGMTWGEWCESEYNTIGYIICSNGYIRNPNSKQHSLYTDDNEPLLGEGPTVYTVIENNQIYKNKLGEPCNDPLI